MICIEAGTGDKCMICGRTYKGGEIVFRSYGKVYCAEFCGFAGGKISIPKDIKEAGAYNPKRRVPNLEQKRAFASMDRKAKAQKSRRFTRQEIKDYVDDMEFDGVSSGSEPHEVIDPMQALGDAIHDRIYSGKKPVASDPEGWVDPMQKVKDDLNRLGGK